MACSTTGPLVILSGEDLIDLSLSASPFDLNRWWSEGKVNKMEHITPSRWFEERELTKLWNQLWFIVKLTFVLEVLYWARDSYLLALVLTVMGLAIISKLNKI